MRASCNALFRLSSRSSSTTTAVRLASTLANSNGHSNKQRSLMWWGASCLVGSMFALNFWNNQASAEEKDSPSTTSTTGKTGWQEWKNSVMTNYEGRIREFSSPEKVFSVFASISKDGHNYMTVDDFIRAVIPAEHDQVVAERKAKKEAKEGKEGKAARRGLPAAFKLADQNGDGLISFEEYLFFVTLLSIPEQSFKVAFRMLDVNEDGHVDQQEFVKLMSFLRASSPHAQQTRSTSQGVAQGWLTHYFGENGSKPLTFDSFSKFLQQLKTDVLRLEFNIYDTQEVGYISQKDFGLLLVSYAQPSQRAQYVNRTAALESTPIKLFTFEQFQNFNLLIEHLSEVETAMHLYQMNGRPFRKQDLSHLSKIVCGSNLNQQVIDTVMTIFDANNDGTLDSEEFVQVLRRRKERGLSEQRDTGLLRKLERIVKCVREG